MPIDLASFLRPTEPGYRGPQGGDVFAGMREAMQLAESERAHRAAEEHDTAQLAQMAKNEDAVRAHETAVLQWEQKKHDLDQVDGLTKAIADAQHSGNQDAVDYYTQQLAKHGLASLAASPPTSVQATTAAYINRPPPAALGMGLGPPPTEQAKMPAPDRPPPVSGLPAPTPTMNIRDVGEAANDPNAEAAVTKAADQYAEDAYAPAPKGSKPAPTPKPESARAQRYGAAIRSNFAPLKEGATDEIERAAAAKAESVAMGALEDHSPEDAEKLGKAAYDKELSRYRPMKIGAVGGAGGGGAMSKQEQARLGAMSTEIKGWVTEIRQQQKTNEAYNAMEHGRMWLRALSPDKRTGTVDRAAVLSLVKDINGRAPAAMEFKAFLDSTSLGGRFDGLINQMTSGELSDQLIDNVRDILAQSVVAAQGKISAANAQLDAAIDNFMPLAKPEDKIRMKEGARAFMFGSAYHPKLPKNVAADDAQDQADDAASDAHRRADELLKD